MIKSTHLRVDSMLLEDSFGFVCLRVVALICATDYRSAPFCLFLLFVLPNNFHPMKLFDPQPQIPQAPMVLLRSTRVLTNSCSRGFGCQKLALCGICGCLCSSFFFRQHCSTQLPPRSLVLLHYCRVFIFFLLTFVKRVPLPPPHYIPPLSASLSGVDISDAVNRSVAIRPIPGRGQAAHNAPYLLARTIHARTGQ